MVSGILHFNKDVTDKLLKFTMIEYPWNATKFTPKFTGITHHVMLLDDMEGLRDTFDTLGEGIKGEM